MGGGGLDPCRQWYYWYLTDAGIEYLRGFLHLPAEVVPETLKKPAARPGARPLDGGEAKGERRPFGRGAGGFRGGAEGGRPGYVSPRCCCPRWLLVSCVLGVGAQAHCRRQPTLHCFAGPLAPRVTRCLLHLHLLPAVLVASQWLPS